MTLTAIRATFHNATELLATLEADGDTVRIQKLGEAFARNAQSGQFPGMANVYAELVDMSRAAYRRARDNGAFEFPIVPATPLMLNDGTYTLVYADASHFTFRIRSVTRGTFAGKRVEYLAGPNNELDFQSFAFVNESTINVWERFERGPLVNRAREIEVMSRENREEMEAAGLAYAKLSGRCRRCNKTLTVAASLAAGYGPECANKMDISYGASATETGDDEQTCECVFYSRGVEIDGPNGADFSLSEDCPIHGPKETVDREFSEFDDVELESAAGRAEKSGRRVDLRTADRMYAELARRKTARGSDFSRCHCGVILNDGQTECQRCADPRDGGVDDSYLVA